MLKEKILKEVLYSLDNLVIDYKVSENSINNLLSSLGSDSDVTYWESSQMFKFRHNFTVSCSDIFGTQSFYIGVCMNKFNPDRGVFDVRYDFNPNKVSDTSQFKKYLGLISALCPPYMRKMKRFDLAMDIPVERSFCHLKKDNRKYSEVKNSNSDRTQYLGSRSSRGRVKLYNKQIESKLDFPLTRLELTLEDFSDLEGCFPVVMILDSFQVDLKISGTDKVLMLACLDNPEYLDIVSKDKRKKLRELLGCCSGTLSLDFVKYQSVIDCVTFYVNY